MLRLRFQIGYCRLRPTKRLALEPSPDRQHTLDMTLTMMRLLMGHERSAEEPARFGGERGAMGLVTSLFHDAGYIPAQRDTLYRTYFLK